MDRLPPRVPTSSDDSPPLEKKAKKEKKTTKDAKETDDAKPKKSEKKDKGKKEKEKKGKKPKEDTEHEMEPLVRKDDDDDEPDDESSGDGELSGVDELVALSRGKRTKKRPAASASAAKQPSKRPSKKTHTKDACNAEEKEARKVAIIFWYFSNSLVMNQQRGMNKQTHGTI